MTVAEKLACLVDATMSTAARHGLPGNVAHYTTSQPMIRYDD